MQNNELDTCARVSRAEWLTSKAEAQAERERERLQTERDEA